MKIQTERLLLVPLGPQYLKSTHEYASDFDNTKYMKQLPNTDIADTKSFLDKTQAEWGKGKPDYYEFAIFLKDVHIGAVSIHVNQDNAEGELGWIISKKYWGNGYTVEAAREIINFAKQVLKIRRFIAHCDGENISSYRVMEKLGMSLTDKINGRKNKSSDEDREELTYLLEI